MRERTAQWGRDGEDLSADALTAMLLDFDDVDGNLHGHCNVAKVCVCVCVCMCVFVERWRSCSHDKYIHVQNECMADANSETTDPHHANTLFPRMPTRNFTASHFFIKKNNPSQIIGVVSDEKPDQVLLQVAEGGELKKFLMMHDPISSYVDIQVFLAFETAILFYSFRFSRICTESELELRQLFLLRTHKLLFSPHEQV